MSAVGSYAALVRRRPAWVLAWSLLLLGGCSEQAARAGDVGSAEAGPGDAGRDRTLPGDLAPTDHAAPDSGGAPFSREGRQWRLLEVDRIGGAPIFPSIALGPDQRPVIAFRKGTADQRYPVIARWGGDSWGAPETVEQAEGAFMGKSPGVAVDAAGGIHLTYYNEDALRLRYAYQPAAGDPWQLSYPYQEAADAGDNSVLRLDRQGRLHCAFLEYGVYHTIYGVQEQGSWSFAPLAQAGAPLTTHEATLAVDAAGQAHLALTDDQQRLSYARGGLAGWQLEAIDQSTPDIGHYLDSSLDPQGQVHIIYLQWTPRHPSVWVGRRAASGWQLEQVDRELGIAYAAAIAVPPCGSELIAYVRNLGEGPGGLWFGYRRAGEQAWSLELVDGSSYVSGLDLLVAADGTLYLVYFDETDYILKTAILPPAL